MGKKERKQWKIPKSQSLKFSVQAVHLTLPLSHTSFIHAVVNIRSHLIPENTCHNSSSYFIPDHLTFMNARVLRLQNNSLVFVIGRDKYLCTKAEIQILRA